MLKGLIFHFLLIISFISYSQDHHSNIQDIKVELKDIPAVSDSVNIVVSLTMSKSEDLKYLDVRVGSKEGQGEFVGMNLISTKENGKPYFKNHGTYHEVKDGVLIFSGVAAKGEVAKGCVLTLIGKNSDQKVLFTSHKKIK